MAKIKAKFDWEAIEREYRAGQLSIREISRQHGCSEGAIRKRAKANDWRRDLIAKVNREVRNKLVRTEVRVDNATDREIVDSHSDTVVNVVRLHRKDISKLRALEEQFLGELEDNPTKLYMAQYQGVVIKEEVGIAVTEKSSALQSLANVQHKRIQLERQAYNMDEGDGGDRSNPKTMSDEELIEIATGK